MGKSENAVIDRLVLVRIPGQTPLAAAAVFHWPPRSSPASNTDTSKPAWRACLAAASPLGPAPMTATRASGSSLTWPMIPRGAGDQPRPPVCGERDGVRR